MANSLDPDQTAPGAVCSESTLFASILKFVVISQQKTFLDAFFSWRFKG